MKKFIPYILTSLISAAIAGGGIYYWQAKPVSENDRVIEIAKAYTDAGDFGEEKSTTYEFSINRLEGEFANVSIKHSEIGISTVSGLLLKRANDTWVVIFSGQNPPDQETINRYSIPEWFYK
jgi:hypothetical protein